MPAINIAVGEPQHPIPPFVGPVLAAHLADFGRYPANAGTDRFRPAVAAWLGRRYALARPIDPASEILVLVGHPRGPVPRRDRGQALGQGAPGQARDADPESVLCRLCGGRGRGRLRAGLSRRHRRKRLPARSRRALARAARAHRRVLSGLARQPAGLDRRRRLSAAPDRARAQARLHDVRRRVLLGNLLEGRRRPACSNRPGPTSPTSRCSTRSRSARACPDCASGFIAGDKTFIKPFLDLRSVAAPQVPVPAQEVAIAAYGDEAHVEENRALYRAKFDLADQIIGNRYGYKRPPGGFFLWLDVSQHGGSEAATVKLWKEAGLRVLPGNYAARPQADGFNPGEDYIRIAMVQDRDVTAEALHRLVAVLGLGARHASDPLHTSPPPTSSRMRCAPRCAAACTRSSARCCSASPASRRSRSPPGRCRTPRSATPPMRRCATCWACRRDQRRPDDAVARHRDDRVPVSGRRLGLALLTHRPLDRERTRAVLWIVGALAAAGFASCLPASKAWPLPTGLGGVIGDALLRVPAWVFGAPLSGATRFAIAIVIGVAAFVALALAAGFGWRNRGRRRDRAKRRRQKPRKKEAKEAPKRTSTKTKRTKETSRSGAASSRSAGSITSATASRRTSRCCRRC